MFASSNRIIRVDFCIVCPLEQRSDMLHLQNEKYRVKFGRYILFFLLCAICPIMSADAGTNTGQSSDWEPVFRVDSHQVAQVKVPAGTFLRGTKDISGFTSPAWVLPILGSEQPQHEVRITKDFWIDKFEVTNAAFQRFVESGAYENPEYWSATGLVWLKSQSLDTLPVSCGHDELSNVPRMCITWFEAQAYATWRGGRLPTEAEWEYAARGPNSLIYPWGDKFDSALANVVDSTAPSAVGSYPGGVSWVGALDMSGNAMEWVQDWLSYDYYSLGDSVDPKGPSSGKRKVEKGGWWGSNPIVARAAYHHYEDPPEYQDHHIGFRVVSPAQSEKVRN